MRALSVLTILNTTNIHQPKIDLSVLPVLPCVIILLWLFITGGTFIILLAMQSDAGKRQGSAMQITLIFIYTAMALLVVPTATSTLLPLKVLAWLSVIGCVGLCLSETIPQFFGIMRCLPVLLSQRRCAESGPELPGHGAARPPSSPPGSRLCIIIPAYIPNETGTLPRTLQQFVPVEEGGRGILLPPRTVILLTYNPGATPAQKQVLDACMRIAERIPNASYVSLLIPSSTCKAHNVNAGLAYLAELPPPSQPDVICIMDADIHVADRHGVHLGCERLRGTEPSTAVVSATTKVSTGSWLVAAEYTMKDLIMASGYGTLIQIGWLTGNFAFIRFPVALSYGFDEKCLLEDNDLMLRLACGGLRIDHCLDLVVYTEAPPCLMAFLTQRTRWGQGHTYLVMNRIPELLSRGALAGPGAVRRLSWKLRLMLYGFAVRLFSKYLIPVLLPTTIVLSWRCGQHPRECKPFEGQLKWVSHFGAVYMLVCLLAQLTAAAFSHPWLRFYHYLAFVLLRIPYGIFNAQAPVIADAQYIMSLNKWIVTERHANGGACLQKENKGTLLDKGTLDPSFKVKSIPGRMAGSSSRGTSIPSDASLSPRNSKEGSVCKSASTSTVTGTASSNDGSLSPRNLNEPMLAGAGSPPQPAVLKPGGYCAYKRAHAPCGPFVLRAMGTYERTL